MGHIHIQGKGSATHEELLDAAQRLGFTIPKEHEAEYLTLLQDTDEACQTVLAQPDYFPQPDFERYPRRDIHYPPKSDNPLGAWAWKTHCGDALTATGKVLSGKTVVFKDTICMAGVPLLFGTDAIEDYTPQLDATVVSRVLEHGGHVLGKAACENMSGGAGSWNCAQGPVDNPYAKGFSAGGSSSGCGALIGSGEVDIGIGGDQGGSVRIPASHCGVVGLKPTFGLVPYTGVLGIHSMIDSVGPMGRTVSDVATLLEAIAGYDQIDDRQLGAQAPNTIAYSDLLQRSRETGVKGMKIGVFKEVFEYPILAPQVKERVKSAIERFKTLGAEVVEVSVPFLKLSVAICTIIERIGAPDGEKNRQSGRRGLNVSDYWEKLLPWDQDKYEKAGYYLTTDGITSEYGRERYPHVYGRAVNLVRKLRDEIDKALNTVDVLVMPTVSQPARRLADPNAGPAAWDAADPGAALMTHTYNLTGHPALSIPVGFVSPMQEDIRSEADKQIDLPTGMMIVGKYWDEAKVFQVGEAWEMSVDWKTLK